LEGFELLLSAWFVCLERILAIPRNKVDGERLAILSYAEGVVVGARSS
jgi:hypothetical protein